MFRILNADDKFLKFMLNFLPKLFFETFCCSGSLFLGPFSHFCFVHSLIKIRIQYFYSLRSFLPNYSMRSLAPIANLAIINYTAILLRSSIIFRYLVFFFISAQRFHVCEVLIQRSCTVTLCSFYHFYKLFIVIYGVDSF